MKSSTLILIVTLFISGCGINLKTPPDLGLKVNLDAKGLTDNIRSFTNKKVRPELLKFLKDLNLKQYILDQGRRYNARCLVPTKQMVDFENHDSEYVFSLYQRCYYEDPETRALKSLDFDISGSVNVKTLKYEINYEPAPEVSIADVTAEDYAKVTERHQFLTE
jgi:hypothetical protein